MNAHRAGIMANQHAEKNVNGKDVRSGSIVLQKSFSTTDQKFAGMWMRFSIQYVRDLIAE
jgi:hypothetical protein